MVIAIGAKDPFADCLGITSRAFLANESVRHQLLRLLAMLALFKFELKGLLVYCLQAGVIDLHGRARMKKGAYLARFMPCEKFQRIEFAS